MELIDYLTKEEKKQCIEMVLDKNQILFHESDICESIGVVIKGQINIVSYTLDGQEIIYNQIKEKSMFGNNLLFSSNPRYRGNVISVTKTRILLIKKDVLLTILKNNEMFLVKYLQLTSDFSKQLNQNIKILSFDSAEDRLLYLLQENNHFKMKSVSDLARQLFMTRETLSRLLTRLEKEGKINRTGNIIELHM